MQLQLLVVLGLGGLAGIVVSLDVRLEGRLAVAGKRAGFFHGLHPDLGSGDLVAQGLRRRLPLLLRGRGFLQRRAELLLHLGEAALQRLHLGLRRSQRGALLLLPLLAGGGELGERLLVGKVDGLVLRHGLRLRRRFLLCRLQLALQLLHPHLQAGGVGALHVITRPERRHLALDAGLQRLQLTLQHRHAALGLGPAGTRRHELRTRLGGVVGRGLHLAHGVTHRRGVALGLARSQGALVVQRLACGLQLVLGHVHTHTHRHTHTNQANGCSSNISDDQGRMQTATGPYRESRIVLQQLLALGLVACLQAGFETLHVVHQASLAVALLCQALHLLGHALDAALRDVPLRPQVGNRALELGDLVARLCVRGLAFSHGALVLHHEGLQLRLRLLDPLQLARRCVHHALQVSAAALVEPRVGLELLQPQPRGAGLLSRLVQRGRLLPLHLDALRPELGELRLQLLEGSRTCRVGCVGTGGGGGHRAGVQCCHRGRG